MSRNDLIVIAFLIGIVCVSGISAYQGGKAAVLLNPPAVPVVREKVVALQPVILPVHEVQVPAPRAEVLAPASFSSPAATPELPAEQAELSDLVEASGPPEPAAPIVETVTAAVPPADPAESAERALEELVARAAVQDSPAYDAIGVSLPVAGMAVAGSAERDPSWWQLRQVMGAGLRSSAALGDGPTEYSATAYGYWEFLRLADVYFTGYGEINNDRDKKVQLDIQWRRR